MPDVPVVSHNSKDDCVPLDTFKFSDGPLESSRFTPNSPHEELSDTKAPSPVTRDARNSVSASENPRVASFECVWFLNDDRGYRQAAVSKSFPDRIRTINLNFKHIGGRLGKERVLAQLKDVKPILVWIRLPGQATIAASKIDVHNANFVSAIFTLCLDLHLACVLDTNVHNAFWAQAPIKQLISASSVHFGIIRWCNCGVVHPQNLRPSSVRVAVLSTIVIPDLADCQCGSSLSEHSFGIKHDLDSHSSLDRQFSDSQEIMTNQFMLVLFTLVFSDLMTHTASGPELRNSFEGFRCLACLQPSPLEKMCSTALKVVECTNVSLRYPTLGPDSSHKSVFPDKHVHFSALPLVPHAVSTSVNFVPVSSLAFPTESRMRQKAKKEADPSYVPVKKKKIAELGYDDCGEDHTPLMYLDSVCDNSCDFMCYDGYKQEIDPDLAFELNYQCFLINFEADLYPKYWLFGSDADENPYEGLTCLPSLAELNSVYLANRDDGSFVDCVEFCGGNARTSKVLIRRRHKVTVGKNFDITVGFDMLNRNEINEFWKYMFRTQPLVVVMSPPCTGLAGFSGLNRIVNPDAWHSSRLVSLPLGDLAGHIAHFQLNHSRHFVCENPKGSELYTLPSWIPVVNHPNLAVAVVDMCMAGLIDEQNCLPLQKRSEIWASDERLVAPVGKYMCVTVGITTASFRVHIKEKTNPMLPGPGLGILLLLLPLELLPWCD